MCSEVMVPRKELEKRLQRENINIRKNKNINFNINSNKIIIILIPILHLPISFLRL